MKSNQLEATAHHEAGHAVLAVLGGLDLVSVTIVASGDANGLTRVAGLPEEVRDEVIHQGTPDPEAVALYDRRMRVHLAGMIAQYGFDPASVEPHHGADDRKEYDEDEDYWERVHRDDNRSVLEQQLRMQTEAEVEANWPLIEKVAAELLKHRTLSREQVEACFPKELIALNAAMWERLELLLTSDRGLIGKT